jgi:hypothetical protein
MGQNIHDGVVFNHEVAELVELFETTTAHKSGWVVETLLPSRSTRRTVK